jgi:hypothetical protein
MWVDDQPSGRTSLIAGLLLLLVLIAIAVASA